mmetsp:Transcript_13693/g.34881  ORF Transcript_13693/g.34881 Transcript_13693/m.34881 type:complete len:268 (-) Transcript_13693:377-1180(-)
MAARVSGTSAWATVMTAAVLRSKRRKVRSSEQLNPYAPVGCSATEETAALCSDQLCTGSRAFLVSCGCEGAQSLTTPFASAERALSLPRDSALIAAEWPPSFATCVNLRMSVPEATSESASVPSAQPSSMAADQPSAELGTSSRGATAAVVTEAAFGSPAIAEEAEVAYAPTAVSTAQLGRGVRFLRPLLSDLKVEENSSITSAGSGCEAGTAAAGIRAACALARLAAGSASPPSIGRSPPLDCRAARASSRSETRRAITRQDASCW